MAATRIAVAGIRIFQSLPPVPVTSATFTPVDDEGTPGRGEDWDNDGCGATCEPTPRSTAAEPELTEPARPDSVPHFCVPRSGRGVALSFVTGALTRYP